MGLYPRILRGARPAPNSLQTFKDNYKGFVIPLIRRQAHRVNLITNLKANFSALFEWTLPNVILITLIPVGVLGLIDRRRTLPWVILPLFPAMYVVWIMFIKYYTCVIAPVVAYSIVLGAVALIETFPRQRAFLSAWLAASLLVIALTAMPEFGHKDKPTASDTMQTFNRLSGTLKKPAVVFFRYDKSNPSGWRHEQTYNAEAARIDDEPVIRAQDLEGLAAYPAD